MDQFKIGDLVVVKKTNECGIIIYFDKKRDNILVRIGEAQLYFKEDEIEAKRK